MVQYVTAQMVVDKNAHFLALVQFPAFVGTALAEKYFPVGTCTELGNFMG